MFKNISVLIPYEPDNGSRDKAFKWVLNFYNINMPEAEICIGKSNSELFSRSQAINDAAKKATRSIYLIVDADLILDPKIVCESKELLKKHAWIIPFNSINYLTESSTKTIFSNVPKWPITSEVKFERIKKPTKQTPCVGGVNIVSRKNFERVGGFDERFIGWGGEDRAFMSAMNTLCGQYYRINSEIFHLWHPYIGPKRNPNYKNNSILRDRYLNNTGNIKEITKLINERNAN